MACSFATSVGGLTVQSCSTKKLCKCRPISWRTARKDRHVVRCCEDLTDEECADIKMRIEAWKNPPEDPEYETWIPQTIEYSVRCAQQATAFALMDSVMRIVVDLPLGRKRKNGLRWSPLTESLHESSVLMPHYCEAFKGKSMRLVVAHEPMPREVPWIQKIETLEEAIKTPSNKDYDIVIIASATAINAPMVGEHSFACCPCISTLFPC